MKIDWRQRRSGGFWRSSDGRFEIWPYDETNYANQHYMVCDEVDRQSFVRKFGLEASRYSRPEFSSMHRTIDEAKAWAAERQYDEPPWVTPSPEEIAHYEAEEAANPCPCNGTGRYDSGDAENGMEITECGCDEVTK